MTEAEDSADVDVARGNSLVEERNSTTDGSRRSTGCWATRLMKLNRRSCIIAFAR